MDIVKKTPVWSSTNTSVATVDQQGNITPVAPGTANIRQVTGITVVADPVSVPPPTPVPSGSSNEPTGMAVVSDRPFNALHELGWDEPSNNGTHGAIVQDTMAPKSPSSILRVTYPKGFVGGGAPWDGDSPPFLYNTLYVSTWIKLSSNWVGHPGSGVNKLYYVYTSNDIPSFYIEFHGANAGALRPSIGGQNIASGGQGFGDPQNPDWGCNLVPSAQVTRGQWFNLEVLAQMNSVGLSDGYIDLWLDGVHVTHVANVKFQNTPPKWRSVHYAPVWGGGGSTILVEQTMDWDHLYISGK